jgi:photosystem II stability/assembly factor-like uncharacterized protein
MEPGTDATSGGRGRARATLTVLATTLALALGTPAWVAQPSIRAATTAVGSGYTWTKLETVKYPGKQDDIFFLTPDLGWYCNGSGRIYKTRDGGASWAELIHQPGTFFRCIGFVDSLRGFAGNVGPGYFPGVTDSVPLYETRDGGVTWTPVTRIEGPPVRGLCAIDIRRSASGKTTIHAGGRVGGPAALMRSDDGGATWRSRDLGARAGMILDVQFLDDTTGVLCAATASSSKESNALILTTGDGGATWVERYRSKRPYELTWKSAFPSRAVGYVTVQSYDPDSTVVRRVLAKTVDGGRTWQELVLADDFRLREFGVGFADERTGWVGGSTSGYETTDGGASWRKVEMGRAVNKIRVLRTAAGVTGYAIGVDVHKLTAE